MEEPKANRLQKKYPAPINWQQFETENLEEYTQDEVAPFLFAAVSHKAPLKVMRKIIDEKEVSTNCRDQDDNLLLVHAILNQYTEAVTVLVNRKARVVYEMDRPNYTGSHDEYSHALTPWQAACIIGKEKYLRLLYEKMIAQDQRWVIKQPMFHLGKQFPIDYALIHRKSELAQFLCSIDKYIITENYDYQRGANAAGWYDATYLKILFENINLFMTSDKDKLLCVAVRAKNIEGVRFLIGQGAKADAQMCASAALQENKLMLDVLLKTGVSLKAKDNSWHTLPLRECLYSAQLKNTVPITLLLSAGAEADEHHEDTLTQPIHHVANKYFDLPLKKSLVQLFRGHGVKLDTQDKEGRTILHHTCDRDSNNDVDDDFIFYLLDLGANPNIPDKTGQTPFLMFCKSNRNPEKLRIIIETDNPDINAQDNFGNTPLVHAAAQGKKSAALIAILVNYHADIAASRNRMLHKACSTLNVDLAQLLIQNHGANAKDTDKENKTTLMEVISAHDFAHKGWDGRNSEKIVRAKLALIDLLVKKGADLNAQDKDGKTALHHTVQENRPAEELLAKLLALGANATIRDKENKTPLEISMGASIYSQNKNRTALLLAHTKENPIILSTGQTPLEYLLSHKRSSTFDDGSWKAKLLDLFTSQTS